MQWIFYSRFYKPLTKENRPNNSYFQVQTAPPARIKETRAAITANTFAFMNIASFISSLSLARQTGCIRSAISTFTLHFFYIFIWPIYLT